ncbi:MAG TPA: E3 binding domain-containing protein, partial [Armatimonadota bacterium]|nr:E3 binding domain-containing protein [Armatimonadota bacterium]
MAEIFHLPQMGQTMTEATILKWLKQEGDPVEGWENILEMMTDKINMEVEPQISGTLRKILAPEGALVAVGAPIAIIGAPDEDISALLAQAGGAAEAPSVPAGEQPAEGGGPASEKPAANGGARPAEARTGEPFPSVSPRAREAAAEGGLDWKSLSLAGTGFEGMVVERDVLAFLKAQPESTVPGVTPLAAKIAADLGVPVEALEGSGPRGRVRAEDVRQAAARRRGPAVEERRIPLAGMRKVIAGRLAASYQQAVHVPLRVDADMTAAADLRRQLKPALESA